MRAAPWLPVLFLLLAAHAASGKGPDPLLRDEVLFLTPDGGLAHEPPAAADMAAPMAMPGQDSVAVWAHDAAMAASFAGDALLTVPVTVQLPAAGLGAPPRAVFTISLLQAGEAVATTEVGPQLLLPGAFALEAALPAQGLAFAAGDSLGLSVALHMLSVEPAPTLTYRLGPEGAQLAFPLRFASLDALGHQHAPGDRHVVREGYQLREGDLGQGLWGLAVPLGGGAPPLAYPANASRLLLQAYLADDTLAQLGVELPGGRTTVYGGEVLVREVPAPATGFEATCTTCSAGQPSLAIAQAQGPGPGEGQPLAQTQARPGLAAQDFYSELWWLLALFSPAGIMLGAAMLYIVRHGGAWHSPEASRVPAARAPQQRRAAQPRPQGQRLQPGAPARRV